MIKNYNDFSFNRKFNILNKEDLDNMSREEIEKYRVDFIKASTISNWKDSAEKRYIDELEMYQHLRFKDDKMKQYSKWSKSKEDYSSIFSDIPHNSLYKLHIDSFKKEYGSPKYILFDLNIEL